MHPPTTTSDVFVIRGGNDAFASRQKRMFDQLSQAAKEFNQEKNCSSLSEREMEILRGRVVKIRGSLAGTKRNHKEMTQYRGKESIFKRPEGPAPLAMRKNVPDHHKNPHKWVKYSLDDVHNEQMSDRSNAQAAFSFLRELRARRANEHSAIEKMETSDDTTDGNNDDGNVVSSIRCKFTALVPFRKVEDTRTTKEPSVVVVERDDKPVFRNSKIILPEYVVGQRPERKLRKTRPIVKVDRSKQLRLEHLEEIDE